MCVYVYMCAHCNLDPNRVQVWALVVVAEVAAVAAVAAAEAHRQCATGATCTLHSAVYVFYLFVALATSWRNRFARSNAAQKRASARAKPALA